MFCAGGCLADAGTFIVRLDETKPLARTRRVIRGSTIAIHRAFLALVETKAELVSFLPRRWISNPLLRVGRLRTNIAQYRVACL